MQNAFLTCEIILTIAADPKMTKYLLPLLLSLLSVTARAQTAQTELPRVNMQAGMYQINAQVASRPVQRALGLMNRPDMPKTKGMWLVLENLQGKGFWVKNTLMPLSAAFIADDGSIVNLADMKPQTTDSHCSDKPVRYVLEMKQGWFAAKQIRKGYVLKSSVFNNTSSK